MPCHAVRLSTVSLEWLLLCFLMIDVGYHMVFISRLYQTKMTGQHVAVLLCTYNGEKYVRQQVESIVAQTHTDWSLWVSDDGSRDRTLEIIRECMQDCPKSLHIQRGPSVNSSHNFMSLLNTEVIQADYFAFADQDDIWHTDKLERALRWHASVSGDTPNLYGGRTHLVDEEGTSIGYSPFFSRKPCFANALIQSIAGGNTMVMNRKARELLCIVKDTDVVSHDWWAYMLVTGAGGEVYYDPVPAIDYRQHAGNLVGSNMGWRARLFRLRRLMHGQFREWTEKHVALFEQIPHELTPENRLVFQHFKQMREDALHQRIYGAIKSRIFRQSVIDNLGFWVAILRKKV